MMKQDFLVIDISHICPTRSEQNDRSSQKQHALNQWSSAEEKGQKLTEAARPEPTVIGRR
jgi:hypothetical protein